MHCSTFREIYDRHRHTWSDDEFDLVDEHRDACPSCDAEVERRADAYLERLRTVSSLDPAGWPCEHMAQMLSETCSMHSDPMDCADAVVVYWPDFPPQAPQYGLPVRDQENGAASSMVRITHCPWCGTRLHPHGTRAQSSENKPTSDTPSSPICRTLRLIE